MNTPFRTPSDHLDSDLVRQEIAHAFRDTAYPGDDAIVSIRDIDISQDEAYDLLHGKTWQEALTEMLPLDHRRLCAFEDSLYYTTDQAFSYYLPAYLLRTLDLDPASSSLQDALLSNLSGSTTFAFTRRPTIAAALSTEQIRAMLHYFKFSLSLDSELAERYGDSLVFWTEQLNGRSGPDDNEGDQ